MLELRVLHVILQDVQPILQKQCLCIQEPGSWGDSVCKTTQLVARSGNKKESLQQQFEWSVSGLGMGDRGIWIDKVKLTWGTATSVAKWAHDPKSTGSCRRYPYLRLNSVELDIFRENKNRTKTVTLPKMCRYILKDCKSLSEHFQCDCQCQSHYFSSACTFQCFLYHS